jgi:predicted NBD/HSP70 family sugar kinase
MRILVIDIGGTNVKVLATGHSNPRRIRSGKHLTPQFMVQAVQKATRDWQYEAVSLGYPGLAGRQGIKADSENIGQGWVAFNFAEAFGKPVKIINDAAMQALGSYEGGGRMLYLGLGTGIGSALISERAIVSLELGTLRYRRMELGIYLGRRGLKRLGRQAWQSALEKAVRILKAAVAADYVVLGGGNAKHVHSLPPGCRRGDNRNAFLGGFRLWESPVAFTHRPGSDSADHAPAPSQWVQV